jgi:hypothetical protein
LQLPFDPAEHLRRTVVSILPTIDMPDPMQDCVSASGLGAAFAAAGSLTGRGAGARTSVALAAVSLCLSGAFPLKLLNMFNPRR